MNYQKILRSLKSDNFIRVVKNVNQFEEGSIVYAKEITENIYLLFIILKDIKIEYIKVQIAQFDSFEDIGVREPLQTMFYLSIKDKKDIHYIEKYLKFPQKAE
ncbi:hypothetical protein N0B16_04550 [Chryseobacterium sp. GMJ5]|uniref:Uncharacterized protein n=1 Tax=Chryseobacterium gilvum TaxID=2976534 RepID=A0ABT2VYZ9_9FLAO|nr:hypothetical protein [Chryseobacterium gilvum]MCU7613700.1 hypothetical protein [Chryseobacterium gilvum]